MDNVRLLDWHIYWHAGLIMGVGLNINKLVQTTRCRLRLRRSSFYHYDPRFTTDTIQVCILGGFIWGQGMLWQGEL